MHSQADDHGRAKRRRKKRRNTSKNTGVLLKRYHQSQKVKGHRTFSKFPHFTQQTHSSMLKQRSHAKKDTLYRMSPHNTPEHGSPCQPTSHTSTHVHTDPRTRPRRVQFSSRETRSKQSHNLHTETEQSHNLHTETEKFQQRGHTHPPDTTQAQQRDHTHPPDATQAQQRGHTVTAHQLQARQDRREIPKPMQEGGCLRERLSVMAAGAAARRAEDISELILEDLLEETVCECRR